MRAALAADRPRNISQWPARACVMWPHCVQTLDAGPPKEERKKPPGEVIRYTQDFLMKFSEVSNLHDHRTRPICLM